MTGDPSGAEMRSPNQTVWRCKIGSLSSLDLPNGADWPMRQAIKSAFRELTGTDAEFVFSGWGAQLTESELAVVENRDPVSSRSSGGAPKLLSRQSVAAIRDAYVMKGGETFAYAVVVRELCDSHEELESQVSALRQEAATHLASLMASTDAVVELERERRAARQEAETLRRVADSKSDQLKPALNSLKEIATITGDATQANQTKIVTAVKRIVEEAETLRETHTRRWNVEETSDGVRVCRGLHDKASGCQWEAFVPSLEAETLRGQLEDTILVGARLSNCAYNLAQNDRGLDYRDQVSLDSARKAWDAAIQKHGDAARVAAPREPK